MNIQITGHHTAITPALESFTKLKFSRLRRLADKISEIHVVFAIDKLQQIAEATIHLPGGNIHARSVSANMYKAIGSLIDKLGGQLRKRKDKNSDHR